MIYKLYLDLNGNLVSNRLVFETKHKFVNGLTERYNFFVQVLFPLLYDLLTEVPTDNITRDILEESRMRTATIMSKVFLHHLTPLITLDTFSDLWIDILDYIEKFMRVGSDMLHEAMLESLKNMLLVMHSVSYHHKIEMNA